MKTSRFKAALEVLEDRLAPGAIYVANHGTKPLYVQLVRHHPEVSGILSDGTSIGAPEPAYTEWSGSYKILPGRYASFSSGDGRPDVRVSTGGSQYFRFSGSSVKLDGPRYTYFKSGYDLKRDDGSSRYTAKLNNHTYGSVTASRLGTLGVFTASGFYTIPNNFALRINGPNKVTGTQTFSFSDHCGNRSTKDIDRVFKTPPGTMITSYQTHVSSARGDAVYFSKDGNTLHEKGFISGGGLFSYGGSYVGTVTVHFSFK